MNLEERLERAARGGPSAITNLLHESSLEVLEALLRNPLFNEDHLLTLLGRKELPRELIETIAGNETFTRSQRVKAALVLHPKTPRLTALRLLKFLYLYDLVRVSLEPAVPGELKRLAEEQIISRIDQVAVGQQITLARRSSARVAAALLAWGQEPVIPAALENPRLTEAALATLLRRDDIPAAVVEAIARHKKWSLAYEVRLQLVRHPLTPLGLALGFLPDLRPQDLLIIVGDKRMTKTMREYVEAEAKRRLKRRRQPR
jgi:predicted regulator of amino acid metabolism with ACT domain